ncbi:MAG: alpha/beta hydrolase family protein [Terriglobales bacterium]
MVRTLSLLIAVLFLLADPETAVAQLRRVAAPTPTGANPVGTLSLRLVDSARSDPFHFIGGKRELLVRFWYPAAPAQACRLADYASPKVWTYLSQTSGIPLPAVTTNSCLGPPIAGGVHPVILFTHGYTGMLTDSTFIFEDLASRGYVVASMGHTYETTAVEFPDGQVITSVFGSYLAPGTLRVDHSSLRLARSVRLADARFVLDELQRLNTAKDSAFAGRLDLSRVGVMGHSLGGEIAVTSLERDLRLRAAVSLDGAISPATTAGTSKPVLLVSAGREQWSLEECQLWNSLRGRRLAIKLKGADHFTPSDAVWLFHSVPGMAAAVGSMGRETTIAALRNYIAAFFDANLRGEPSSPLLSGTSPNIPDAIVTTQPQELCGSKTITATGGLQ